MAQGARIIQHTLGQPNARPMTGFPTPDASIAHKPRLPGTAAVHTCDFAAGVGQPSPATKTYTAAVRAPWSPLLTGSLCPQQGRFK